MKKHNDKRGIVFSTNPNFKFEVEENTSTTLSPSEQQLYLVLERLKGGKVATVIENFVGNNTDLNELGKKLKSKCGVGGSVKDGVILLQGDHRDKIIQLLSSEGYKIKKKGG